MKNQRKSKDFGPPVNSQILLRLPDHQKSKNINRKSKKIRGFWAPSQLSDPAPAPRSQKIKDFKETLKKISGFRPPSQLSHSVTAPKSAKIKEYHWAIKENQRILSPQSTLRSFSGSQITKNQRISLKNQWKSLDFDTPVNSQILLQLSDHKKSKISKKH